LIKARRDVHVLLSPVAGELSITKRRELRSHRHRRLAPHTALPVHCSG
jgi:hypothetical protein